MSLHVIIMSVLKGIIIRQEKNENEYNKNHFKVPTARVLSDKSHTFM